MDTTSQRNLISDDVFRAHLHCPYKAHLKLIGHTGDVSDQERSDKATFEAYRRRALEHLLAGPPRNNVIDYAGSFIDALPTGVPFLLHGRLRTQNISSRIDVLEKVPRDRTYVPVLISPSATILWEDRLLLGFQGLTLSAVQGKEAPYGKILHGASFSVHKLALHNLGIRARSVVTSLEKVATGAATPRLMLNRHCNVCEFRSACRAKAVESDDVSLIQTLKLKDIAKLNKKGIFTITQYAFTFRPRRKRRKLSLPNKHDAALKALALREHRIYVNRRPPTEERPTHVFLDVEGLPDEGLYYLIGFSVSGDGRDRSYSFWADDKAAEEKMWKDFLRVIEQLGICWIFHFGSFESRFVTRMLKAYGSLPGVNPEDLQASLRNVLTYYHLYIYLPTYSNGLKEVANYFGFTWTSSVKSGSDSILWRRRWEADKSAEVRDQLLVYNREDCEALKVVTQAATGLVESDAADRGGTAVTPVDQLKPEKKYRWGRNAFGVSAFEYINKCAYFDYQQAKIYWRTNEGVYRSIDRGKRRAQREQRFHRPNTTVQCRRPRTCVACQSRRVVKHGATTRTIHDLRFSATGVKRWIVRYVSHRYKCQRCDKTFYPADWPLRKTKYGHGFSSWIVYQSIGLRQSHGNIIAGLNDIFGWYFQSDVVSTIKEEMAALYLPTYEEIEQGIRSGPLVHVDETRVSVKGAMGYVWVFAGIQDVVYVYADSREADVVMRMLKDFKGVLISDFYPAYESVPCLQQRCLIHLIRDLNDDLFTNPFDREYKVLVEAFGELLRPIIMTVDRCGLKARFLRKYKQDVRRFFRNIVANEVQSELTRKYQARFRKNEKRLFTFLDHDGIPWNNNNAENAIKGFATLRQVIGGSSTEKGLKESLRLLSIAQTLRNRNISFLEFLRSGKLSINDVLAGPRRDRKPRQNGES